jgi:hypothetical protein
MEHQQVQMDHGHHHEHHEEVHHQHVRQDIPSRFTEYAAWFGA